MNDDVVIGKFGRAHGVTGELRFFLYNPESEAVAPGVRLTLVGREVPDGSAVTVKVSGVRTADKFLIVTLAGVDDRNAAERLCNTEASVPRSALPAPDPDEFYLVDVVGFEVLAAPTAGAEAVAMGRVKGWLDIGPQDIMAITGPDIAGRLLVPYVDNTVDRIDFEAQQVLLHPLDTWMPEDD